MKIDSVLITGANRGLGLEFIKQFLTLSTPPKHIIAVCREPDKAADLQKLASGSKTVHLVKCEITDPNQHDKAVSDVRHIVGDAGLDLLINNAGIFDMKVGHVELYTKESLMQHMDVNLATPLLLIKAFLPLLKGAAEKGKTSGQISAAVVNISAILGCVHGAHLFPGAFPYHYTKAALNMATYLVAADLEPSGILVTAIHPGWVQTDMGGPHGALTPFDSISGCLKVITALGEEHRGKLFDWKGELIPY